MFQYTAGSSSSSVISRSIERRKTPKRDFYGYYATADILPGTLLMTCPPISWAKIGKSGTKERNEMKYKWAVVLWKKIQDSKQEADIAFWNELCPREITPDIRATGMGMMSDDAMSVYLKVARNTMTGDQSNCEWECLYNELSFVNHSCCSNTTVSIQGDTKIAHLYAVHKIKANEEITYTYGSDIDSIQKEYMFVCQCTFCQHLKTVELDPVPYNLAALSHNSSLLAFMEKMPRDKQNDCWGCWHPLPQKKAKFCASCKKARYCGPACQKRNWFFHKTHCLKRE